MRNQTRPARFSNGASRSTVAVLLLACSSLLAQPASSQQQEQVTAGAGEAAAATFTSEDPMAAGSSSADSQTEFRGPLQGISLLGTRLYALPREPDSDIGDRKYNPIVVAAEQLQRAPNDPEQVITLGVAQGLSWRFQDAISTFSQGLRRHQDYAPLYRYRGHRYITLRQFDLAVADLEKAAELDAEVFDHWYHLGLAYYLAGSYDQAAKAYFEAGRIAETADDVAASAHWLYMSRQRNGDSRSAMSVLEQLPPRLDVENHVAYEAILRFYEEQSREGEKPDQQSAVESLLARAQSPLDQASLNYGIGNWHLYNGRPEQAASYFEAAIESPFWPAFGFIAAEVELARGGVVDLPGSADTDRD